MTNKKRCDDLRAAPHLFLRPMAVQACHDDMGNIKTFTEFFDSLPTLEESLEAAKKKERSAA